MIPDMESTLEDRYRGCLLGLAAGDAVGTTVEFQPRGSFPPVTDMIGGGPFGLRPGEWTDDTSMALCLGASLLERGAFDPRDQLNRYLRWWREGEWSSNGRCFDIGNTVRSALRRYERTGEPFPGSTDPRSAGNGCIMRLAPVVLFFHPDREAATRFAGGSSRTTHGALECVEACRLLAAVLCAALDGAGKEEVLAAGAGLDLAAPKVAAIARGEWRGKEERDIRGSGYVVESLEAALWCFWKAEDFADAVLRAANLGADADTTGAVCGQVAGAFFGAEGIPAKWLGRLARRDEIAAMAAALGAARPGEASPARPIEHCYWVVPGRLLAGEYPGDLDPEQAKAKVARLEDAGVDVFVDLTGPADHLVPYAGHLRRARHEHFPLPDVSVPRRREEARRILDCIDGHLEAGRTVYVHCRGGVGRTGVVIGCWLARHGQPGQASLDRLAALWRQCPKSASRPRSPETGEQEAFVRTWREERAAGAEGVEATRR